MFRIGLTGNVASGKSSVARVWARHGAPVVDADVLARDAVAPGSPGLERVRRVFGDAVVTGDGLDRAALRRIVFADPAARARLEGIVHPEVGRLREEEEARLAARGATYVVHDVPLLFEVGLADQFDLVVLVDAPESVRAERLARDRGLDVAEIQGLMAAQAPAAEKRARADVIIDNTGSLAELEAEAGRVWEEVLRPAALGGNRGEGAPTSSPAPGPAAGPAEPMERVRVDMHVHTRLSFDCRSRPDAVVARAVARGLSRVCITDHNEIEAALALAERHPDHVIPGEEVKTAEGVDIIGLFLREWIPKGTPARETCERIRDQGGLVYMPHPFAGGKGGGGRILEEVADLVDIVEGFNARIHQPSLNDRARSWAAERGLPLGAGSDAHTLSEIGNGYVEMDAFRNDAASFLAALRGATVHGREASRLVHVASTLAKLLP
jgi:dephospho-CoA kinase